jgi:hypothetical protein
VAAHASQHQRRRHRRDPTVQSGRPQPLPSIAPHPHPRRDARAHSARRPRRAMPRHGHVQGGRRSVAERAPQGRAVRKGDKGAGGGAPHPAARPRAHRRGGCAARPAPPGERPRRTAWRCARRRRRWRVARGVPGPAPRPPPPPPARRRRRRAAAPQPRPLAGPLAALQAVLPRFPRRCPGPLAGRRGAPRDPASGGAPAAGTHKTGAPAGPAQSVLTPIRARRSITTAAAGRRPPASSKARADLWRALEGAPALHSEAVGLCNRPGRARAPDAPAPPGPVTTRRLAVSARRAALSGGR